jgi:hypothetical protein
MCLQIYRMDTEKLENTYLALNLSLQIHAWEAALLQSIRTSKFFQIITAIYAYPFPL